MTDEAQTKTTDRAYKVGVLLRRILTVAMWFPGLLGLAALIVGGVSNGR